MKRRAFPIHHFALATIALLTTAAPVVAAGPKVVNIINFIRGTEPRANVDLLEPVVQQIRLAKQHGLPTTFLIQYDALVNPAFVNLLKTELGPDDEVGIWLEVVQPQVEAAGLTWRGRWTWDYNAAVGLTQAYSVEDRKKLMDVFMARFKTEFGRYPRSVGCWVLDAPTLNYLYDEYHIVAACNCKDQSGTDGYTLWGGYWNQAYYPSRQNAFMPAQNTEQQLNVPIFRMLGSDPVYQYDHSLGTGLQGVISLEPVYRPGGGSPDWVRWFFDANFNAPNISFAYTQAGQENSFGWPAMKDGLEDQYQLMKEGVTAGTLRVETLEKSGAWYRESFEKTPATAVVAMDDFDDQGHRSIWYESRFYRVNFYWEGNAWRIRDLHVFNEKYPERYLKDRVTGGTCTYDTLPVMDGFHWSTATDLAGIRPLVNTQGGTRQLLGTGTPVVTEVGTDGMLITMPVTSGGELKIHCNPSNLSVEMTGATAPADWGMELGWSAQRSTAVVTSSQRTIGYQHNNFGYALRTGDAKVSPGNNATSLLVRPDAKTVTFDFDPANATSYWDTNDVSGGSGGPTPAGSWNGSATNWTASLDGTTATTVWPGTGHTAVFAAGTDATGSYTVNVSGAQAADGVVVKQGNVTLSGGSINLATPAVMRAETGTGLTLGTQLTGTSGLLLEGEGAIQLSGTHSLSGPLGISTPSLTLASGASFPALSNVSLGSGAAIAANGVTLGLTGSMTLNGASFTATGATVVAARGMVLTAAGNAPVLSLADTSAITLTAVSPALATFEIGGGSLALAGSSKLVTDRWTNRGSGLAQAVSISGSALLSVTDDLMLGGNASAAVTVTQTGGVVTNTGTRNNPGGDSASNRWGLWGDSADAVYNISGGSLNLTGAPLYLSWDSAATLNISGTAKVYLKGVNLGWNARAKAATINLTGGELIIGPDGIVSGGGANKSINLGAGILGASASWSSSMPMNLSGAATVNTSGGGITLSGALSGTGSLTKTGSGTLVLGGTHTFTGPANISAGLLRIGGISTTNVNVASGAAVGPGNAAGEGAGTVGALNLASGSTSTFRIGGPASDLTVSNPGGLTTAGTHIVNVVASAGATPGAYPLFRYSGTIGGAGPSAFVLGTAPRMAATLVNNPATSSINLVVTAVEEIETTGVFIQELFDAIAGSPPAADSTLNGKGNTSTSLGLTGSWLTNGGTGIFTASNFDTGSGLPGLAASNGFSGGIWNNSASYNTTIFATRPLAKSINFGVDQTIYLSFRANNSGDTSMGVGLAAGSGGSSEFVGAGLTWNNARSMATGQLDSGNTSYISYGTLDAAAGPYGVRAHGPAGSVNAAALTVARLTIKSNGPDLIDIKKYSVGDVIENDPSTVAWTASDSVISSMVATNLLLWTNGANLSGAGELDAIRFGTRWSDVTGAMAPYDAWAAGAPYFLAGLNALPNADPDGDGIANAIEFIIGGNPVLSGDAAKMPVGAKVGDNFEFTFRRTDISNSAPFPSAEYGSALSAWTTAQHGVNGVVIAVTDDFYGAGIDRLVVKIPQSLATGQRLFARLNANR